MTKKLTWEVEKTSLVLKVTDGAKETTWKLRKSMSLGDTSQAIEDIWLALQDTKAVADLADQLMPHMDSWPIDATIPMYETARTVDAEELAELRGISVDALTEEGSKEALNARVAQLNRNARWMDADGDEIYTVPIPDYDAGEI